MGHPLQCCQQVRQDLLKHLTGAGGGLGRHLARELARRGCRLALVDVAEDPLEKTLELVRLAAGGAQDVAEAYVVDLRRRENILTLVEAVVRDFGQVHILVSNAAIMTGGLLESYSDDTVDAIFDVNLMATVRLCRVLVPRMRAWGGGHLVAISSMAASVGVQGLSLYCATKAGLTQFMESLYHELRATGDPISTTTVHPSFMTTAPFIESVLELLYAKGSLIRYLVPMTSPMQAAERVMSAIANREVTVFIPDRVSFLWKISRLFPRWAVDALMGALSEPIVPSMAPPEFRHRARTATLLRELLEAGHLLLEDPADMMRELQGLPRHELQTWKPHAAALRGYYSTRGRPAPAHVLHLLQEMESEGAS